ncbi:MAG: DNA polymerase III subunit delta [Bergeyella sp.]|nr:DNA polymerase III subunit delta [Bergeyella sp.]
MKELDSLLRDIKNRKFLPLYFFHGPEPYFIDLLIKNIEENVLNKEEKAFNQVMVYGKDTTYPDILSMAKQYPVMSDKKLIIVKEAQDLRLTDTEAEALMQYATQPVESTVLVFSHKNKKLDGKKRKLHQTLKNYIFLSDEIKDWNLSSVIQKELDRNHLKARPNIAPFLAQNLGNDLSRIFNEIAKVKILLKEGEWLDADKIEKYVGISKDYNVFELQKAVVSKDLPKALKIINVMGQNEKAHSIISMISVFFNYFSRVILFHVLRGNSPQVLASELGIAPAFIKDYENSSKLFSLKQATRVISILRDIDLKAKGLGVYQTSDKELMKEMVYKVIHIGSIETTT